MTKTTLLLAAILIALLCGRGVAQTAEHHTDTLCVSGSCSYTTSDGGTETCDRYGCHYRARHISKKVKKAEAEFNATHDGPGFTKEEKAKVCEGIQSVYCLFTPWVSRTAELEAK